MEMRPPVPDDASVREFRVDTHSLKTFGEFVRRELDENIGPMAQRVGLTLTNGAMVGSRLPSADVEAMNSKHAMCIEEMALQLESYKANMAIIADAAQRISTRYSSSDALAGASLADVSPIMNQAIGDDTPPPAATPHGALV
jgi:hypothetical protein